MTEKWAIAYEPWNERQSRFQWVRDRSGEILVFGSNWEAKRWVLTNALFDQDKDEVVYIKLPSGGS
jgi:hypothetical protein